MKRRLLLGLCGGGVAMGLVLAMDLSRPARDAMGEVGGPSSTGPSPVSPTAGVEQAEAVSLAPLDFQIEEAGRLAINAASLPEGRTLSFGLALSDEARGDAGLTALVVSVDGRRLELPATPIARADGGVRVAIDSSWLKPGRYLIQIRTSETVLALRRYVVEVRWPARLEGRPPR
jgi:hypothetical protein